MHEFGLPALYHVPADANLTDLIEHNAARQPDLTVISRKVGGRWRDVTAAQFRNEVRATAKGLIANGIQAGDRVAVMSRTRYEWNRPPCRPPPWRRSCIHPEPPDARKVVS
ncbi:MULTISPECIES: AMP-binding protein [Nocardia]|uniref:AMP-binding protein n=1 Tax=Nocardia abscessus TaxID=120957 RepID=UPI003F696FD1